MITNIVINELHQKEIDPSFIICRERVSYLLAILYENKVGSFPQ